MLGSPSIHWNPPGDLSRASRFIAMCWTCNATGRIECTSCHVEDLGFAVEGRPATAPVSI
jgi:hypothetical protein